MNDNDQDKLEKAVLKDNIEKIGLQIKEKIKSGELEGWSKGEEFRRKEICYDNGHQWSGGCSNDGYYWKEFCTNCFEKRTRCGYPDWWFKPIR